MKIGYARVSTDGQKLDLQIDALKQAGCEKIYNDEGFSGASTSRPALDACLESLKHGDCLVVYKLDRLGRSLEHVMSTIKRFEDNGIDFKSISEGFDTTTPAGKLIFHVIGALAQFERELIRERVIAGLEAAKERGVKLGRKETITDDQIKAAIQMRGEGHSYRDIGHAIGISRASAHRVIKERTVL